MLHKIVNVPSPRGTFFELFAIDIRSLALLRIGLAVCLLYYVGEYFAEAELFLSGSGVLPVAWSRELLNTQPNHFWSLYWISDSRSFCQLLLATHLSVSLLLLFGFQTRLATIACLVLTWSLEIRNPLIQDNGIHLLRMLLLWSAFLPLARVWSIDSMLDTGTNSRKKTVWAVANVATCAMVIQVLLNFVLLACSIFLDRFSVVEWFQRDIQLSGWGHSLLNYPMALDTIGWAICIATMLGPITMFLPYVNEFFRGLWLAVFWLAQILTLLLICPNFYPLVAMVSWLLFVPGHFWNDWLGEPLDFDHTPPVRKDSHRRWRRLADWTCGGLLVLMLLANFIQWRLLHLGKPANWAVLQASQFAMVAPRWNFEPTRYRTAQRESIRPWFVYLGTLEGNRSVDLMNFQRRNPELRPSVASSVFPTERWRRIHIGLFENRDQNEILNGVSSRILARLVNRWNGSPPDNAGPLSNAKLICFEEFLVDGQVVRTEEVVWAEE